MNTNSHHQIHSILTEKSSGKIKRFMRKAVLMIVLALIVPITYLFVMAGVTFVGEKFQLFYLRPELPLLTAIVLIPGTCLFLHLLWRASRSTLKKYVLITLSGLLVLQVVSGTAETINALPVAKIYNNFTVPSGWEPETQGNGVARMSAGRGLLPCIELMGDACPYAQSTWIMNSSTMLTNDDLLKIAIDNGYSNFKAVDENNTGRQADDALIKGVINGKDVTLGFYVFGEDKNELELRLDINSRWD